MIANILKAISNTNSGIGFDSRKTIAYIFIKVSSDAGIRPNGKFVIPSPFITYSQSEDKAIHISISFYFIFMLPKAIFHKRISKKRTCVFRAEIIIIVHQNTIGVKLFSVVLVCIRKAVINMNFGSDRLVVI